MKIRIIKYTAPHAKLTNQSKKRTTLRLRPSLNNNPLSILESIPTRRRLTLPRPYY